MFFKCFKPEKYFIKWKKLEVNILKIELRETTNKNIPPIFKRPGEITDLYKGTPILKSNSGS